MDDLNDPSTSSGQAPSTDPGRARRGFDLRMCLALGLLSLVVYNANMRLITAGDNYPTRYLPFALLGYGTLGLDPVESVASQGRTHPYWIDKGRNGGLVSHYPVVIPVLVSPLYLPAIAWLDVRGWTDQRVDRLARLMEKLSASLIASVSVALMYLLLRRRADVRVAVLLTIAYAFGTNTWMIGSQGLWQHGMGELLVVIALLIVTGPCTAARAFATGAVCVLMTFNRPPDAIIAAGIGLYCFWWAGIRTLWVVAGALVLAVPLMAYNIGVVGHILGGYASVQKPSFFRFSVPPGIAALLFSPGRGLFVFTQFLLALPFGLRRALGGRVARPLPVLMCVAFVLQVVVYAKTDWRGGVGWGPRYLTNVVPLLVWLLSPVVAGLGRPGRVAFGAAVCASVAIQAVGAFWYTGKSDEAMHITSADPALLYTAWNPRTTPFIFELRHAPAPRDLLLNVQGGIDGVTAAGREAGAAAVGTQIVVRGWALANGRSPVRVVASLVTGKEMPWNPSVPSPVGEALVFQPRPDVSQAMHTKAASGWEIVLQTANLAPGGYMIEAAAEGQDGGEYRPIARWPFKVLPVIEK